MTTDTIIKETKGKTTAVLAIKSKLKNDFTLTVQKTRKLPYAISLSNTA